ncbi:GrxA family glutaredoxin [Flocculibacter collagenilyticus]|uniref:GrxA family glutaredoxin n=1 Tax=Flocculibacter collagenilyticus TaxID=2744479 RepID=UPI0018F2D5E9|nr:GrxA family glutaredoxin [Flocculibacter collagenilyticus]
MYVVIFGKEGCPYCVRAKQLAEQLSNNDNQHKYRYVDIHQEGLSKADLEKTIGRSVNTVPQIFIDEEHIGGCDEFETKIREMSLL